MNPNQTKNILVVEDDPFMQTLYRKALEREGFTIHTASNGQAAMEMLPILAVDLVVLDLMLPKVHGLQVLDAIRQSRLHQNLPVVILSNAYLPEVARKAMESKATTGMLKSDCSPRQLVKIIRETLQLGPNKDAADSSTSGHSETRNGGVEPATADHPALAEIRAEIEKNWQADISSIRELSLKYVKTAGSKESEEHLQKLYGRLRYLAASTTMGQLSKISLLSNALEAMLFEYGFNVKRTMSPSVVQTMVQGVDCLEHLFKAGHISSELEVRKTRILLVDDDPVCNIANELALKRANFETICANDGAAALVALEKDSFDLVLLDVNMPGMTGFEVCEKTRKIPRHKETPVIFVTLNNDIKSRAQSVLSGSNGIINKPISPLELIIKALIFLLRGKVTQGAKDKIAADQLAAVESTKRNIQPEITLAESRNSMDFVSLKTEPEHQKARSGQPKQAAGPAQPEGQMKMPPADENVATEKLQALNEALAAEKQRAEAARHEADETAQLQIKLEAELNERTKLQEEMFVQLAEQQQRLAVATAELEELRSRATAEASQREQTSGQSAATDQERAELEIQLKAARELAATRESARNALEAELQKQRNEQERLVESLQAEVAKRCQLDAQIEGIQSQLAEASRNLAQKSSAEQAWLERESELQNRIRAQETELAGSKDNLSVRETEIKNARTKVEELQSVQAGALKQVQDLTGQTRTLTESLNGESGRRATAEQQVAALVSRRIELEQQLIQRTQAQEQLRSDLAEHQQRLETQTQAHKLELGDLVEQANELKIAQAALAELKTQSTETSEQIRSLTESLAAETGKRQAAEQEWAGRESELQGQIRNQEAELAGSKEEMSVQVMEIKTARTKIEEFESLQADTLKQVEDLTGQNRTLTESLTAETSKRETAEKDWAALESELQNRIHSQETELAGFKEKLSAQKTETKNAHTRIEEFESLQASTLKQVEDLTGQIQELNVSLNAESARRTTAEQQVTTLETSRTGLEQQLQERTQAQEQMRAELLEQQQRLETTVQAQKLELDKLAGQAKELPAALAALTELKAQHAGASEQVRSLTESLSAETGKRETAEKEWAGRESELQNQIRSQEADLAKTSASLVTREAEIKNVQQQVADMQGAQLAQQAVVQNLTGQLEAATNAAQSLKDEIARLTEAAASSDRKMAALRYAVLDASRMNTRLQRERQLKEQQNLEAMRSLLSSLAQTPLSLAQRGMLSEIQNSLAEPKNGQAGAANYPVEQPGLQISEFDLAEFTESALSSIRAAAGETGVVVQASVSGETQGRFTGCPEFLHQLITLAVASPLKMLTGVSAVDLQLAVTNLSAQSAEMTVRANYSSNQNVKEMHTLASVASASSALQTGNFTDAELGLAAGSQLAEAMGARLVFETGDNHGAGLVLNLPLETVSARLMTEEVLSNCSSVNGHVNGDGRRNGSNGHVSESRISMLS